MFQAVNTMAKDYQILSSEEHDVFCSAYIRMFGEKYEQLRIIASASKEAQHPGDSITIQLYGDIIRSEMKKACKEGARVVQECLIASCPVPYNTIVYHKM